MDNTSEIYLFNPENDMALANFTPYYQAPADVRVMREDLQLLPVWYATEGAQVKVSRYAEARSFLSFLHQVGIPLPVTCISHWTDGCYRPWGWSPALVHQLLEFKVSGSNLYSPERLAQIREFSGRPFAAKILSQLNSIEGTCGKAFVCNSIEVVCQNLNTWGKVVLKSPWSGSGRGVMKADIPTWNSSLQGWVRHILRTQRQIMVEPCYSRCCDFAMEFYIAGGCISFVGYSLFDTDDHGNYKGNLLMPDMMIVSKLTEWVSSSVLEQVKILLMQLLQSSLAGVYEGYLGVDMMVCCDGGKKLLHPCVEINLRMNMGVVSRLVYDRWISPFSTGRFVVEHYSNEEEALQQHLSRQKNCPLFCEEGKIREGYLSLTPVSSQTRYQVYIQVHS